MCYHYTIPLRTNDIIQIFWDLSTLLPHIFHEMKNTPVGPARTRRQGREKRTQRSRIFPSIEIVTTCHGRNFPLARSASRAACSSPPQHGTSMRATVTDALSLDYQVTVISDCCSARTPEIAEANLTDMRNLGARCLTFAEWHLEISGHLLPSSC